MMDKIFTPILRQYLVDLARREHARKRPRMGNRVGGDEFLIIADARRSQAPQTEKAVIDKLYIEGLLVILDRHDASLRMVMVLKWKGYSNEEIGAELQRSEKTIERRLQKIRSILKPHVDAN